MLAYIFFDFEDDSDSWYLYIDKGLFTRGQGRLHLINLADFSLQPPQWNKLINWLNKYI